jgi:hypothetical protein
VGRGEGFRVVVVVVGRGTDGVGRVTVGTGSSVGWGVFVGVVTVGVAPPVGVALPVAVVVVRRGVVVVGTPTDGL